MKKVIIFLLIIEMFFSFNIGVLAEGEENNNENDNTPSETETGNEIGDDNPVNAPETEEDQTKSIATLNNICIDGVKVICNSNNVCEYIINDNSKKSVKITYDLPNKDAVAEPKSGFTKDINDGENKFDISVTSADKTKNNTYQFVITKKNLSSDSTLKSLIINGKEINLKEDTIKYSTSVSFGTKKIEVEAIPNDEKSKIIDFKNNKASFDFFETSKDIKIKIQSEAGEMTTYTITVSKRSEADVTLKTLKIKNHEIDFSSEITDYELKVLKSVTKLEIEAKATDKNASVNITNPKLNVGENEIKIEVSNDGNIGTYIIKVTKLNEDDKTLANLKSLEIENYDIDFKPNVYEYDLKIENENYLSIKAIAKLEEADVDITGNLDLEDGSIIKIKVTYDDEFYNVYKINIIKDGKLILKDKVNKKAVIAVIIFDIISIITIAIFQIFNKKNKKSKDDSDSNNNSDNIDLIKTNNKRKNILNNLDDEIDII